MVEARTTSVMMARAYSPRLASTRLTAASSAAGRRDPALSSASSLRGPRDLDLEKLGVERPPHFYIGRHLRTGAVGTCTRRRASLWSFKLQ